MTAQLKLLCPMQECPTRCTARTCTCPPCDCPLHTAMDAALSRRPVGPAPVVPVAPRLFSFRLLRRGALAR